MTRHVTPPALATLRARFAELFGNPPPPAMRAAILAAAIAWKEQVLVHGDIEPAIARDLAIIADEVRRRRLAALTSGKDEKPTALSASSPPPLLPATTQLRPGTRLVRAYRGITHIIEVTTEGFMHDGVLHASLSAVAKVITGTHWNGLLFFGLRRRKTPGGSTTRKRRETETGRIATRG